MAPGLSGKLHQVLWRNEKGRPMAKLNQHLKPEEGKTRLRELLEGVKALMRISTDWKSFMQKLDVAYPKFGDALSLPFDNEPLRIGSDN